MKENDIQFLKEILEKRKQVILENLKGNSKEIKALHNSVPSDNIDFSTIESNSQRKFKARIKRNRRIFK